MTEEEQQDFQSLSIADENVASILRDLPDEALQQFSFPLFNSESSIGGGKPAFDADGFPELSQDNLWNLHKWQEECWKKAESNPQINSHIRDRMGRMTGWGFSMSSQHRNINNAIEEIMEDPRNNLYESFPKYVARDGIEGELFLVLTLHKSGFVEVDFVSPSSVSGGGDKGSGIIFHPTKQNFPLFYLVRMDKSKTEDGQQNEQVLIPSINIAYYPELEKEVNDHASYSPDKLRYAKVRKQNQTPYDQFNGYYRFMIHWNKGFMTRRNVSNIKTTIEWVNYYEALKKYEIDHKKSSGAYLWVVQMEDIQTFRRWLQMTEEERKKTGIMESKDPGGTLVLPPGMTLTVENPNLPNISGQDTDIMQMISSGLQKPQDTLLGDYSSSYASVKASEGPQSDRNNDELHYFKMFLLYSFWRPIFFLRATASNNFSYYVQVNETTGFDKNQKPIIEKVKKPAYKLVDVNLPVSRLEDIEATARALLGTKHGSVVDTLNIPREEVAARLGFNDYHALVQRKATEDEELPPTLAAVDQESEQEKRESEPGKKSNNESDED